MNRIMIVGRISNDLEYRLIGDKNTPTASFSIAFNQLVRKNGEYENESVFLNCKVYGSRAKFLKDYSKKGSKIAIDGRLNQDSWVDADGNRRQKFYVLVDNAEICDPKKKDTENVNQNKVENQPVNNKKIVEMVDEATKNKPTKKEKSNNNGYSIDPDSIPF